MTVPPKVAADWDGLPAQIEGGRHYLDAFLGSLKRNAYQDLVARWGAGREHGLVLKTDLYEEACGPDHLLPALDREARRAYGFDVALSAVLAARRRHPELTGRLIVADVRSLPYKNESFDLVVSASTLDHFPEPSDLGVSLRELERISRRSARVIVTLDNRGNVLDPLLRLVNWFGLVPFYLGRSYRVNELEQELNDAGLLPLDKTAIVHNPRLFATGSLWLVRRLGSRRLRGLLHRALARLQGLEATRWRYLTGCFVAVVAEPSARPDRTA